MNLDRIDTSKTVHFYDWAQASDLDVIPEHDFNRAVDELVIKHFESFQKFLPATSKTPGNSYFPNHLTSSVGANRLLDFYTPAALHTDDFGNHFYTNYEKFVLVSWRPWLDELRDTTLDMNLAGTDRELVSEQNSILLLDDVYREVVLAM